MMFLQDLYRLHGTMKLALASSRLAFSSGQRIWSAIGGMGGISQMAADLQLDLLLLSEDESDPSDMRDSATFARVSAVFDTHCHGSIEWGWRRGNGVLQQVTGLPPDCDLDTLINSESTILMVAAHTLARTCLARIASDLPPTGLDAMLGSARVILGSSSHHGDFLWLPTDSSFAHATRAAEGAR